MLKTTDDTALASYLYLKGVKFIKGTINTEHCKRRAFVFHDCVDLDELIQAFYNRTDKLPPLDYQEARSAISKFLKVDVSSKIKIKTEE